MNVFITGCNSGFGLSTAIALARRGDRVFATVRDRARAGALLEARERDNLPIDVLTLDLLDDASVRSAVAQAEDHAPLDVVVNNAGYELVGPIEHCSDDEFRRQMETNALGPLRVMRAVLPAMRSRGRGRIVNVSSVAGIVANPFAGVYSASKHALEAISEALRAEVAPFGIEVVLVEPGSYPTTFSSNYVEMAGYADDSGYRAAHALYDRARKRGAASRSADPQEVVDALCAATHEESPALRKVVGETAEALIGAYRQLPWEDFERAIRAQLGLPPDR